MDSTIIKLYKNIAERRVPNIKEILFALDQVALFIKRHRRILYGGMAIDMALKYQGHAGIYTDAIMPDYDFYSPENAMDSLRLARILDETGELKDIDCINALHLTTCRVRINSFNFVADLSYYPEPYYGAIPTLEYKGFRIVHPDFQRIDLHRSLSFPYEGAMERENYKNRYEKDIKRWNLLNEICPLKLIKIKPLPSTKNLFIDNFGIGAKIPLDVKGCIGGNMALHLLCQKAGIASPFKTKSDLLISPDYLEIYTDDYNTFVGPCLADSKLGSSGTRDFYDCTVDVFPEAAVDHPNKTIYYYNYGERITAVKLEACFVVGVHALCFTYLFKHFMLGSDKVPYIKYYQCCMELLKAMPPGADYYGAASIYKPALYSEKKENCALSGVNKNYRPMIRYYGRDAKLPKIDVENYVTYHVAGHKAQNIPEKTNICN